MAVASPESVSTHLNLQIELQYKKNLSCSRKGNVQAQKLSCEQADLGILRTGLVGI